MYRVGEWKGIGQMTEWEWKWEKEGGDYLVDPILSLCMGSANLPI